MSAETGVTSKRSNPNVEMQKVDDEDIRYRAANFSGYYLSIGNNITIKFFPAHGLHWCGTCNVNECAHTRRAAKWMETHPPPADLAAQYGL